MNMTKNYWIYILLLFTISASVYGNNSGEIGDTTNRQDTLIFRTGATVAITGKNITIGFLKHDLKFQYDQLEAFDSTGRNPNWIEDITSHNLWASPTMIITGENITHLVATRSGAVTSGIGNTDFTKCESLKYLHVKTSNATLNLSKNIALEHLELIFCWGLESLDLSYNINLKYLHIDPCFLNKLDVSHNTKLERLYCNCIGLTELDLSQNVALEYVDCRDNNFTPVAIRDVLYSLPDGNSGKEKTIRIRSQNRSYFVDNRIGEQKNIKNSEINFDRESVEKKGWIIE